MEKYVINGGIPLKGEVEISGAKNAAVAIIPAALLGDAPSEIENAPIISDVNTELQILRDTGAKINQSANKIYIDPREIKDGAVSYETARAMRASCYFLGVFLTKFGRARVYMPGGCNLGDRPIDQHIKAFKALGAKTTVKKGIIDIEADALIGTQISFDLVTVGGTINAMLASVKARGVTYIENAAKEPHVVDAANFLNSMGADITGAGTDSIRVKGVSFLKGAEYEIIPDQIEAGTYMTAIAATKGEAVVKNVIPKHLESISSKLEKLGVIIEERDDGRSLFVSNISSSARAAERIHIKTSPHPGFPTDMQPQFAALLSTIPGASLITEGVFENRFRYADELRRMGADISVDGRVAVIEGVPNLFGANLKAADLRAGAALIIAALCADGRSEIEDIFHIERGYENMVEKFRGLGADISKRIDFGDNADSLCNVS